MQKTPIETLNVSNTIIFNLKNANINYIDDLFHLSKYDILKINGIGKKSFEYIINALEKINLDTSKFTKVKEQKQYPYNLFEDIYGENIVLSENSLYNFEIIIAELPATLQNFITFHYKQNLSYNKCVEKMNVSKGAIQKYNKEIRDYFLFEPIKKYVIADYQLNITNPTSAEMVLSLPIIKAGFEFSLTKILLKNNYETIGDIVKDLPQMYKIKGIGETTYKSLTDRLMMFGIYV